MAEQKEITRCSHCGNQVQVPVDSEVLKISCPYCHEYFLHHPTQNNTNEITPTPPVTSPDAAPDISYSEYMKRKQAQLQNTTPEALTKESRLAEEKIADEKAWAKIKSGLLGWPIAMCFAFFSYYLLRSFSGKEFWILLGVHLSIASLVGMMIARLFGEKWLAFHDEFLSRAFIFLMWFGVSSIGGIGAKVAQIAEPIFYPLSTQIWALQTRLVNSKVQQPPPSQNHGLAALSDVSNWFSDIVAQWRYTSARDDSWDETPYHGNQLLNAIEVPTLSPVVRNNQIYAVINVVNKSNLSLKELKANVGIGNVSLGELNFSATSPIYPNNKGEMIVPLAQAQKPSAIKWQNGSPVWISDQIKFQMLNTKTEAFDRLKYADRNLDKWLAE